MNRHTKRKKDSLIVIQGNRCAYCGKWMPIGTSTLDHIIPKSKNGTNSLDNLVVCCRDCNLEKDNDYIIDRLD
jgi:5-methylcytosine-specific restriction endonuclease McrA